MIEIAPGVRAGMVQHKARGAVHLAIAVEVEGHVSTVYLDEIAMDRLLVTVQNTMLAAQQVRLGNQPKRMRWPARAR